MHNLAFALQEWIDCALSRFDWGYEGKLEKRKTGLYITFTKSKFVLYQYVSSNPKITR